PGFSSDLNTQKSATGTRTVDALGEEHCSAFCYRITVVNQSDAGIELRNLSVTDVNYPGGAVDLAAHGCTFPTTLGVVGSANASASCIVSPITLCEDTINIVTATAQGVIVSDQSSVGTVTAYDTNR